MDYQKKYLKYKKKYLALKNTQVGGYDREEAIKLLGIQIYVKAVIIKNGGYPTFCLEQSL